MPRRGPGKFKRRAKVCNVNIKRLCVESADEGPRPSSTSRPTVSTPQTKVVPKKESSSKKKVGPKIVEYDQLKDEVSSNYDIINLKRLEILVSQVAVCVKCSGRLVLSTSDRKGLSLLVSIKCSNCGHEASDYNDKTKYHDKSEINSRLVYGMRCIGKGETSAKTLCGVLNLPSPPQFRVYNKILGNAAKEVCLESMREAVEETVSENDGNRDITANFDGTWQRRGHRSLNGAVTAISGATCKVLDVRIFSKHCRCKQRLQNIHTANCVANYAGASGGMEVEGVVDMFRCSVPQYDIRYKYYLGDGDSAAFPTVANSNPYGPNFSIEKLECVGHVQKRMGARLDKFKTKMGKTKLADDKTIGGRGRLTGAAIKEIQLYYGLAIRRNTFSLNSMRQAVWAEFYHLKSTNDEPLHGFCPDDPETWCKYHKAKAEGKPYDHSEHFHLPPSIMAEIKPIFLDLSLPSLLRKCLHGGTQNANESLNSVIWSRVPKSSFVMKETLEFGAYEAIACYNMGNIAKCKILKKIGIAPGDNCVEVMKKADELRVRKAEKSMDELEKKCRKQATLMKNKLEDENKEQENQDMPAYGAGLY